MLRFVSKRNASHIYYPALKTMLVPGDGMYMSSLSQAHVEPPSSSGASRQEILNSLRKKLAEGNLVMVGKGGGMIGDGCVTLLDLWFGEWGIG